MLKKSIVVALASILLVGCGGGGSLSSEYEAVGAKISAFASGLDLASSDVQDQLSEFVESNDEIVDGVIAKDDSTVVANVSYGVRGITDQWLPTAMKASGPVNIEEAYSEVLGGSAARIVAPVGDAGGILIYIDDSQL